MVYQAVCLACGAEVENYDRERGCCDKCGERARLREEERRFKSAVVETGWSDDELARAAGFQSYLYSEDFSVRVAVRRWDPSLALGEAVEVSIVGQIEIGKTEDIPGGVVEFVSDPDEESFRPRMFRNSDEPPIDLPSGWVVCEVQTGSAAPFHTEEGVEPGYVREWRGELIEYVGDLASKPDGIPEGWRLALPYLQAVSDSLLPFELFEVVMVGAVRQWDGRAIVAVAPG